MMTTEADSTNTPPAGGRRKRTSGVGGARRGVETRSTVSSSPVGFSDRRTASMWCLVMMSLIGAVNSTEFCLSETFNVTCAVDELILMTSAIYGRMRSGRCVKPDYGHMGCQADVTQFFDDQCSGRRHCEVPVTKLLTVAAPCPLDMTSYMEASYACAKVPPSLTRCSSDNYAPLVDHQDGHIPLSGPSSTADQHSSGPSVSRRCPWLISVDPNQHLEFTILAFGLNQQLQQQQSQYDDSVVSHVISSSLQQQQSKHQQQQHRYQGAQSAAASTSSRQQSKQPCPWNLVFEESGSSSSSASEAGSAGVGGGGSQVGGRRVDYPLCRVTSRQMALYTSTTNRVTVYLQVHNSNLPFPGNYILRYEAVGCPRLKAPSNVWVTQDRTTAKVKCNATEETWFLACNGRQWTGELGNCSASPAGATETGAAIHHEYGVNSTATALPYGFLMAVIIGVLLGVLIGAIPLGLVYVCLKRKWKRQSPIYAPDGGYGYGIASNGPAGGGYYPELQHVIHQTPVSTAECDDLVLGRSSVYPALLKPSTGIAKTPDSPDSDGGFHTLGYGGSPEHYGDGTTVEQGTICNCRSRSTATVGCYRHPHRQDCILVDSTVGMVDASGTLLRTFGGGYGRQEHVYESASFARAAAAAAAAVAAASNSGSGGNGDLDVVGVHRHPSLASRGFHQHGYGQQHQQYGPSSSAAAAGVYYEVDADGVNGDKNNSQHHQLLCRPIQMPSAR